MCRKDDVYQNCPSFEDERFLLRLVQLNDYEGLLKVYSDKNAVPLFNSDNCGGDNFYYTTKQKMKEVIKYWFWEYKRKGFVRWSIVDKATGEAVGTIELFHRKAKDYFTNCGLLRLDLRSDYETEENIKDILSLIIKPACSLFDCKRIATKAVVCAAQRRKALEGLGFVLSAEKLTGHDGTLYSDYYILE